MKKSLSEIKEYKELAQEGRMADDLRTQNQSLREAIAHYEAALKLAFPYGASALVHTEWNVARIISNSIVLEQLQK